MPRKATLNSLHNSCKKVQAAGHVREQLGPGVLEVLPLTVQLEDSLTKAASRNDDKDWLVDLSNLSSQGRLLLRTPRPGPSDKTCRSQ